MTYDFKCGKCGSIGQVNASIHETPALQCVCGEPMVKVILPPAVSFRGTGWGREAR